MQNDDKKLETFDDATNAFEEQLAAAETDGLAEETQTQESTEETSAESAGETQEAPDLTEQATQTAEVAAQAAVEKDQQLQQVLQELAALKEQNETLQNTIKEMSNQNKEELLEEVMPVLDVGSLAFDDEETIKQKQTEYAQKMVEYVKKELEPFIQQAQQEIYEKEKSEVISALAKLPELQGIDQMIPQLDKIIANTKALSSPDVPVEEKYVTAYAIAKGVNSINNPPKEPTPEELLQYYDKNEDFRKLVESKLLERAKGGQQVPPLSASGGAVNAALTIQEKPKTIEEASNLARKLFGAK